MKTKIVATAFLFLFIASFAVSQNTTSGAASTATSGSTSETGVNSGFRNSSGIQIPNGVEVQMPLTQPPGTNSFLTTGLSPTELNATVVNQDSSIPGAPDSGIAVTSSGITLFGASTLIGPSSSSTGIGTILNRTSTTTSTLGATDSSVGLSSTPFPGITTIPIVTVIPSTGTLNPGGQSESQTNPNDEMNP